MFLKEAELCLAFAETVPSTWTVYNETAGFDMVLVHESGFQIGIEAKLRLNAKVVRQAVDIFYAHGTNAGPDARAVLVPQNKGFDSDIARLCKLLSLTIITVEPTSEWSRKRDGEWFDLCPVAQAKLPEYVPDVPAGHPSPVVLGRWMNGYWLKKGKIRGNWVAGPDFPFEQFRAVHPTIVEKVISDFEKWSVENGLTAIGVQDKLI